MTANHTILTLEKKRTVDDFQKIEEGNLCELINGEIIMAPSPSTAHQRVLRNLFKQIANFLDKENLGEVFCAPLDVYFDEENVFEPDIFFISKQRLKIIKEDGIYGAPDLIIEILSLSNTYHDTKIKKKIYEKYGVKEYWIVDPFDGEVIGYKNENNKFVEFNRGAYELKIKLFNMKIKFEA